MSDPVNHPAHYGGANNPYEAIKVIEAWDLGFCLGNTVKYIARAGAKVPVSAFLTEAGPLRSKVEDLKKAQWYLRREIANTEKQIAEAQNKDGV